MIQNETTELYEHIRSLQKRYKSATNKDAIFSETITYSFELVQRVEYFVNSFWSLSRYFQASLKNTNILLQNVKSLQKKINTHRRGSCIERSPHHPSHNEVNVSTSRQRSVSPRIMRSHPPTVLPPQTPKFEIIGYDNFLKFAAETMHNIGKLSEELCKGTDELMGDPIVVSTGKDSLGYFTAKHASTQTQVHTGGIHISPPPPHSVVVSIVDGTTSPPAQQGEEQQSSTLRSRLRYPELPQFRQKGLVRVTSQPIGMGTCNYFYFFLT
eukprot:PhF_6_TR2542/c0_g1_i2/m.4315